MTATNVKPSRKPVAVDKLVVEYLSGRVSMNDAIASLPEDSRSWGDVVLQVILPADMFRRRLERASHRTSRVLIAGRDGSSELHD